MNTEAPINTGHTYANSAEEYEDREMWSKAIEAHNNAAEQFQLALDYTQDTEAGKTLRLLIATHTRKAKDLQRKVLKLKAEQQLRQQQLKEARSHEQQPYHHQRSMSNNIVGAGGVKGIDKNINMNGLLNALPNDSTNHLLVPTKMDKSKYNDFSQHNTIGESYALLSADNDDDDDDASDPFNKFLHAVEVLVDQLSNPVAFVSAPLNEDDISTPYHQRLLSNDDGNNEEEDENKNKEKDNNNNNSNLNHKNQLLHADNNSLMMESFFLVPDHPMTDFNNNYQYATSSSSITTVTTNHLKPTNNDSSLKVENDQLKRHIDLLIKRIKTLEKSAEESHILKSSILQFRNDVQRQAKRIMQSHHGSASMRSSSVALLDNSSIGESITQNSFPRQSVGNQTNGSTAELVTRLKELEDENRKLKDQVDKQQLLMNKYRERWEKLKESAKKRRAQPQELANQSSEIPRQYSARPPALLRSLAQQNNSSTYPFASSSSITSTINNNYNNNNNKSA
ncbi:unnamed protein product [Cunninghamella blakesleeana]